LWEHFSLDDQLAEGNQTRESFKVFTPEKIFEAAIEVLGISFSQDREVIDFDDMILAPLVHKARFWTKRWVLLDESQDTNPARRALALAMLDKKNGRMIFVGDDRQAIYGFTGADGNAMDMLQEATNAIMLPLNMTMRCPKAVVALAQTIVPDITAHTNAPEGIVRSIPYDQLISQKLTLSDAILCRNTAPLISTAFTLLSNGIACKVEGRDIGDGLIRLSQRWKVKNLAGLLDKLVTYQESQTAKLLAKKKEILVAQLEDQLECLRILIARCTSQNRHNLQDLVDDIKSMFGDTADKRKPVLTLATVHRSKGREWPRVFILGRDKYMPNRWAKLPWELTQEANLEYVAITRAQAELLDVVMPVDEKKGK
jgi:superfamily I DNA/RNA helicase